MNPKYGDIGKKVKIPVELIFKDGFIFAEIYAGGTHPTAGYPGNEFNREQPLSECRIFLNDPRIKKIIEEGIKSPNEIPWEKIELVE